MLALVLSALLSVCAAALAELPRSAPARFRSQRIELAPTTTEAPETTTELEGPYPPSGWRPAGEPFSLPDEGPKDSYGAPAKEESGPYPPSGWKPAGEPFSLPNEAPDNSYGAPAKEESAPYPPSGWKPEGESFSLPGEAPDAQYGPPDVTSTEAPPAVPLEVQRSAGSYFVVLPDGRLQPVLVAAPSERLQRRPAALRFRP